MPKKTLPRIDSVKVGKKESSLLLVWTSGLKTEVDVSGIIATYRIYEPLRRSAKRFASVRLGDLGTDVIWNGGIDMAAETLWRLAQEQLGLTMTPEAFKSWRVQKAYTLDAAADALGLSRRMVAYYEKGSKPIPKVVALATKALNQ